MLPGARPVPVAPARIGRDEQGRGIGVGVAAHPMPPVANRRHREPPLANAVAGSRERATPLVESSRINSPTIASGRITFDVVERISV